jgi:hypothetical protein
MRLVACLVCVVALALPAAASADGDPASDYLLVANTFLPYPPPSAAARAQLSTALASVSKGKGRVKVAVIATANDLGAVPSLFGRPADYARFLGQELSLLYHAALLVVMPAGYGLYEDGKPTPAGDSALAGLSIGDTSPDGLTRAAAQAVTALAHAGALVYTDTSKPSIHPSIESGRSGRPLKLLYQAYDDSGRAAVVLSVLDGSRRVALFKVPVRAAVPGVMYSVTWRVPADAPHGQLAYCARATDPSGNRSRPVCAKLTIR